jgi:hypothetical protein
MILFCTKQTRHALTVDDRPAICTAAISTLFVGAQELVSCYACLSEYRPQG